MPVLVVDASAVASILFVEDEGGEIAARLGDASLIAPGLLPYELDAVCWKKIRANPGDRQRLLAARAIAYDLRLTLSDVEPEAVIALALATGLTTYDASYLHLAVREGAALVTLDARLSRAAARLLPP